jgi:hypothetical protein
MLPVDAGRVNVLPVVVCVNVTSTSALRPAGGKFIQTILLMLVYMFTLIVLDRASKVTVLPAITAADADVYTSSNNAISILSVVIVDSALDAAEIPLVSSESVA